MNNKPATVMVALVRLTCTSNLSDMIKPMLPICSVNCTWSQWSAWETCSVTCGGGTQRRNRLITEQAMFGGNECTGEDSEQQSCNRNGCPGKIAYISMRRDINIGSKFYSELHLGRMECLGNLLRNLWRGNPRKIQINNATTIVWWQ